MRKVTWPILCGFIIIMAILLPAKAIWMLTSYFDGLWDNLFLRKIFNREIPLAGFFLSLVSFWLIGKISETALGNKLREKILKKIPLVGRFLSSLNPKNQDIMEKAGGFIIARYMSEWRPARLTSIKRSKTGYFGIVLFISMPPIPQIITDESPIYVLERIEKGDASSPRKTHYIHYDVIPNSVALGIELSAGTTVPEDALKDAVEITFGSFIRSFGSRNRQTANI